MTEHLFVEYIDRFFEIKIWSIPLTIVTKKFFTCSITGNVPSMLPKSQIYNYLFEFNLDLNIQKIWRIPFLIVF